MNEARKLPAKHRPIGSDAGRAHCTHRHAMIGMLAADDLYLFGLTLTDPEKPRGFDRAVIGITAAGGKEKMIDRLVGHAGQPFCELYGRKVGVSGVCRAKCQLLHLPGRGFGQFLPAVPEGDVPQARQTIDILTAVGRLENRALTLYPYKWVLGIVWVVKRMNQMLLIGLDDFFQIYCHHECSW